MRGASPTSLRLVFVVASLVVLGVSLGACRGTDGAETDLPAAYVPFHLDKDDPERLLRYYFGAYAAEEGADPFQAGLLLEDGRRFYVNLDSLEARHPGAVSLLVDRNNDGRFDWDELEAFVDQSFYQARHFPATLAALREEVPYEDQSGRWFVVDVQGVMSTARRKVYVAEEALRTALRTYHEHDARLLYPAGTAFVGEHYLDGERVETTVMRKRADGQWDFFVYDAADSLARQTTTPPRALKAPVQCVGCHFGNRLFEPEKSFPGRAEPGPHGPRQVYVDEALRNGEVMRFFDEHRKRSDAILGLYGTLYVARLVADRDAGRLAEEDVALLRDLGL